VMIGSAPAGGRRDDPLRSVAPGRRDDPFVSGDEPFIVSGDVLLRSERQVA
jgi:hypothetical protein